MQTFIKDNNNFFNEVTNMSGYFWISRRLLLWLNAVHHDISEMETDYFCLWLNWFFLGPCYLPPGFMEISHVLHNPAYRQTGRQKQSNKQANWQTVPMLALSKEGCILPYIIDVLDVGPLTSSYLTFFFFFYVFNP